MNLFALNYVLMTNRARYLMNPSDERVVGKFYAQQRKVYNLYRFRRVEGLPCDGNWFQSSMRNVCKKDMPEGYDPNKPNQFGSRWRTNFCKRWKISSQKKTNSKSKSVYERIHKVRNYHYYVIYKLGRETHEAEVNHTSYML